MGASGHLQCAQFYIVPLTLARVRFVAQRTTLVDLKIGTMVILAEVLLVRFPNFPT